VTASVGRNFNLGEAAWHCRRNGNGNLAQPISNEPPPAFAEHDDCDPSASQIFAGGGYCDRW
jgi:hypothetical protein